MNRREFLQHTAIFGLGMLLVPSVAMAQNFRPYGPGLGFNEAPDLGPIPTADTLRQKVTISWLRNRLRSLFGQRSELAGQDPNAWAYRIHQAINTGMFVVGEVPNGGQILGVSETGGHWSLNRTWTARAPLKVWNISNFHGGWFFEFSVAMVCGNAVYTGIKFTPPQRPPQPPPPTTYYPPEAPPEEVPEMAYFWGQYVPAAGASSTMFQPMPVAPVSSLPEAGDMTLVATANPSLTGGDQSSFNLNSNTNTLLQQQQLNAVLQQLNQLGIVLQNNSPGAAGNTTQAGAQGAPTVQQQGQAP